VRPHLHLQAPGNPRQRHRRLLVPPSPPCGSTRPGGRSKACSPSISLSGAPAPRSRNARAPCGWVTDSRRHSTTCRCAVQPILVPARATGTPLTRNPLQLCNFKPMADPITLRSSTFPVKLAPNAKSTWLRLSPPVECGGQRSATPLCRGPAFPIALYALRLTSFPPFPLHQIHAVHRRWDTPRHPVYGAP
jgi:hypothetical protein